MNYIKIFRIVLLFITMISMSGCFMDTNISINSDFNETVNITAEGNVPVSIQDPVDDTGNVKVKIIETTEELLNFKLITQENITTLTVNMSIDDRYINVTPGHNITAGKTMNFYCEDRVVQINAEEVNGNNITLAMDSDINCNTTDFIMYGRSNAAVFANTTSRAEFCFMAYWNNSYHIDSGTLTIRDESAMDDGLFGSLPQLDYPVFWRATNSFSKNMFPMSRNGAARLRGAIVDYVDKAPAGEYAVGFTFNIGGPSDYGSTIVLHGPTNDTFCFISPSDLSALSDVETVILGHVGEE